MISHFKTSDLNKHDWHLFGIPTKHFQETLEEIKVKCQVWANFFEKVLQIFTFLLVKIVIGFSLSFCAFRETVEGKQVTFPVYVVKVECPVRRQIEKTKITKDNCWVSDPPGSDEGLICWTKWSPKNQNYFRSFKNLDDLISKQHWSPFSSTVWTKNTQNILFFVTKKNKTTSGCVNDNRIVIFRWTIPWFHVRVSPAGLLALAAFACAVIQREISNSRRFRTFCRKQPAGFTFLIPLQCLFPALWTKETRRLNTNTYADT